MELLWLHAEIFALSGLMVGLVALRGRTGLAPLIIAMGVLLAFVSVAGRLGVTVPVLGGERAYYGAIVHLPVVLVGVVLVYALEGTRTTQRLLAALVAAGVLVYAMRELLALQLDLSQLDPATYGRARWTDPHPYGSLVSTITLLLDGIVIIVAYQGLRNLVGGRIPVVAAFSVALMAGAMTDGVVYGGLSGMFDLGEFGTQLLGKATAALAAAIPASLYISWQYRKHADQVSDHGLLRRSALEIVNLKRQMKTMMHELSRSEAEKDHIRSVFGRYVAPDVVDEILSSEQLELGGELREVTIVFSDIRGYSTLSEAMSPVQTIGLLNDYFAHMGEVITHFRGTIIEFEGDAILVVFGAPLDQPDHAERAIRSSLMMLEVVDELNRRWEKDGTAQLWKDVGIPEFRIRIGVHTGHVVVGNVGSQNRTKYAVIGDTVNTAARVESLNKTLRTTLLLTEQTRASAGDLRGVDYQDMGEHTVRGRREHVQVFTVRGAARLDTPLAGLE